MSEKPAPGVAVAVNRKARHDYFIEERYEAGLALLGLVMGQQHLQRGRPLLGPGGPGSHALPPGLGWSPPIV